MTEVPQRPRGEEAQRPRLRDRAGLLASGLAHGLLLVAIILFGSPNLFATVAPEPIVVEIVRAEELAKGELREPTDAKQSQAQSQQQAEPQKQQAQPQKQQAEPQKQQAQPQKEQAEPQKQQAEPQKQAQPQPQPLPVSPAAPAAPVFASLYPWPVTRPASDVQGGDYRTFESTGKLEHEE